MSVTRANAAINEQLVLTVQFTTGGVPANPFELSQCQIKDANGTVLETILAGAITQISTGLYRVTTSAAWNTLARTVYDNWTYKAVSGGSNIIWRDNVIIQNLTGVASLTAYVTPEELRAATVGIKFTDYSIEELRAVAEVAKDVIDTYTNRKFGPGIHTERGVVGVAQDGRVIVPFWNYPAQVINSFDLGYGGVNIAGDVGDLELYLNRGFGYYSMARYPFSGTLPYPTGVLHNASALTYNIEYVSTAPVPPSVKYASILIAANLLQANTTLRKDGVTNADGPIASFKSGDYQVVYGSIKRTGEYSNILTDTVKLLLKKYKRGGQNTF